VISQKRKFDYLLRETNRAVPAPIAALQDSYIACQLNMCGGRVAACRPGKCEGAMEAGNNGNIPGPIIKRGCLGRRKGGPNWRGSPGRFLESPENVNIFSITF
jgi:hypothetical protein